jgi:uncharacterized membrane protein YccC
MAVELVRDLERDAAHAPITTDAVAHAKEALERAVRLRGTGDEAHARVADALAREWAQSARDLVRATEAEAAAVELRRKAVDAQARVERARALVEEAIARVGRVTAELDEATRNGLKGRSAVEVHEADSSDHKHGAPAGPARRGQRADEKERSPQPPASGERP